MRLGVILVSGIRTYPNALSENCRSILKGSHASFVPHFSESQPQKKSKKMEEVKKCRRNSLLPLPLHVKKEKVESTVQTRNSSLSHTLNSFREKRQLSFLV